MRIVRASLTTPSALLALGTMLLFVFLVLFRNRINLPCRRILCFLPLVLCLIHGVFYYFGKQWIYMLYWFGPMYLTALLIALWQFIPSRGIIHGIATGCILLLSVVNFLYIPTSSPVKTHLHNYSYQSWTDSFVSTVSSMEKEYALSEWKGIDYDALLEEFVPRIRDAENRQDVTELGVILLDFANRFYDGHVSLQSANREIVTEVNKLTGKDYGLSLISLDTGEVVAVQVEPGSEAEANGIHTGTVVTHWNGTPVQEAKNSFRLPICPSVAQNEEPLRTILLAGQGGDSVEVTFLADNGEQKTVLLHTIGDYTVRYESAWLKFLHVEQEENFSYKMLSDTCGYLRIHAESLNALETAYAWITGQAPFITKRVDKILTELQAQGMESLIIDIRNNTGGHPQVSTAVASLFTKETYTYGWESDGEQTSPKEALVLIGNGKWVDLPVVVLVNQSTVSAGDAMADLLSKVPNVTLMGMTHSDCSYQTTGGVCFLAKGAYTIYYPVWREVDGNGVPIIDTDVSRETRIPLDVKIPVDASAIQKIYSENPQDHELEYAMEWIESQN